MTFETAKGVKDWYGKDAIMRNHIRETLRQIFESYGYNPIETPIIETQKALGFKGGGEIQKEVFKLSDQGGRELALRFDHTVPLARFFASHNDIKLPFKRYAIGEVFRDGPTQVEQGRYRIFTQCDIDVLGIKEMTAEMEIFFLARDAFLKLGLGDVEVKINNRKVLDGIISYVEIPSQIHNKAISILDKMDKIGLEGVKKELLDIKGPENISEEKVDRLTSMISREMTNEATYNKLLKSLVKNTGLEEIKQVLDYSKKLNLDFIQFDPSLARGLDYYTGTTIEVYLKDKELLKSAIVAGGRFDNMIGDFRNERQEVPAVGISFGLERILTVLQKKSEKFKKNVSDIYIIPIGDTKYDCLGICQELRKQNLNVDMHHTKSKRIGDIISYADSTGIRYVGFLGETEIKEHSITLKNLQNENQKTVQIEDVYNEIKIL